MRLQTRALVVLLAYGNPRRIVFRQALTALSVGAISVTLGSSLLTAWLLKLQFGFIGTKLADFDISYLAGLLPPFKYLLLLSLALGGILAFAVICGIAVSLRNLCNQEVGILIRKLG